MWSDDLFDHIVSLVSDSSTEIELYDGEFLDPERIAELEFRYSTKNGVLLDVEEVIPVEKDQGSQFPLCRVVVVMYCVHSNKRSTDKKVRGSIGFASSVLSRVVGRKIASGTDHGEADYQFGEIIKEDQIPFVSVYAARVILNIVIDFSGGSI